MVEPSAMRRSYPLSLYVIAFTFSLMSAVFLAVLAYDCMSGSLITAPSNRVLLGLSILAATFGLMCGLGVATKLIAERDPNIGTRSLSILGASAVGGTWGAAVVRGEGGLSLYALFAVGLAAFVASVVMAWLKDLGVVRNRGVA